MDGLCYKCWMRSSAVQAAISCIEGGAGPSGGCRAISRLLLPEHSEISLQALAPDLSLVDKHLVALEGLWFSCVQCRSPLAAEQLLLDRMDGSKLPAARSSTRPFP